MMKHYCTLTMKPYTKNWVDKKLNIEYNSISLTTMQLPCFNSLRTLFYNAEGIKVVPKNIYGILTPAGLAHWIQGDGSYHKKGGVHLSTYAFSSEDIFLLEKVLVEKFNLKVTKHLHKTRPRIYIHKESLNKLKELVSPYMVETMKYKLGLNINN
jgi:hypothetical protein